LRGRLKAAWGVLETEMTEPLVYTLDEAAHALRISRRTIIRMIRDKQLNVTTFRKRKMITHEELMRLILDNTTTHT
jgi:excisionase family DNA binding protein